MATEIRPGVTIVRPFVAPGPEDSGQSGMATLECEGLSYEVDYSAGLGLSVMRAGDFPDGIWPGWCGVNTGDDGRLRPGYYDAQGRWVDVEPIELDREVWRWVAVNYARLFGLTAYICEEDADPDGPERAVEAGRIAGALPAD